jgi:hypothetical protein
MLGTLFMTELLYVFGMPLIFDLYESFKVLLDAVIICQFMFLVLMRNQIKKMDMQAFNLRLNKKMTNEEFELNKMQVTDA